MFTALKIIIAILSIWIALGLLCALWVGRRRRTGTSQVAADPYFRPFGEMPTVPPRREQRARDFRAWGLPETSLKPSAGLALRSADADDGRRASTSAAAVVLTFPGRDA